MQQQLEQPHALLSPDAEATPQFLRVRRRRGAVTVPSRLRLDLDTAQHGASAQYPRKNPPQQPHGPNVVISASLNQCQQDLLTALARVGFDDEEQQVEQQQQQQPLQEHAINQASVFTQQVVFRRVSDPIQAGLAAAAAATGNEDSNGLRKRRVLDAVILEDDDDEDEVAEIENSKTCSRKRRRLQLLPSPHSSSCTATKKKVSVGYPVLTPTQCRVDESLKAVFDRTKGLSQHLRDLPGDGDIDYYYAWNNPGGLGNWLHAAALWNEVDLVRGELQRPPTAAHLRLRSTRDAEGRTPAQVATLAGHDDLAGLLMEETRVDCDNHNSNSETTGDEYEYDYYCWQPLPTTAGTAASNQFVGSDSQQKLLLQQQQNESDEDDNEVLDCELHNRCSGYFDATGKLVLEFIAGDAATEDMNNCATGMMSSAALVTNGEYDDHDSNDEDWEGNDYPDEDDWSSSSTASLDFRQRCVPRPSCDWGSPSAAKQHGLQDDEDDAYDTAYDAAYGGIYGQDDNDEYDEEC